MHRSRLAGFIIDYQDSRSADPKTAGAFWSAALGMAHHPSEQDVKYEVLDAGGRDLAIEVQRVDHDSRVHLDIEADDVEAEVARLEQLGARRIEQVNTWWVMEAPTGHRFCVIRGKDFDRKSGLNTWK